MPSRTPRVRAGQTPDPAPSTHQTRDAVEPAPGATPGTPAAIGPVPGLVTALRDQIRFRLPAAWFALAAILTIAAHAAAVRTNQRVAALGEARLAAAAWAMRRGGSTGDSGSLVDRLGALQLAVLETLLPVGGVPVLEAARWACAVAGVAAALLLWPVLRGVGLSQPSSAVGVAGFGVAGPALMLTTGVSSVVLAASWLALAAAFAIRRGSRGKAATCAAALAISTAPLAAAALLAFAAHVVLDRTFRCPARVRIPLAIGLGGAALAVGVAATTSGPLAGAAGSVVTHAAALVGASVGLLLIGLAWTVARWLRPVLSAAVLLLAALVVPGPSRADAALLAVLLLAIAAAVLVQYVAERARTRWPAVSRSALPVAGLLVVLVVPALVGAAVRAPAASRPALAAWVVSDLPPGTVLSADALDRAELVDAGFPPDQLRRPDERLEAGFAVVADRPGAGSTTSTGPTSCADGTTIAVDPRGSGGAAAAVCRTDGDGPVVAAERTARARLGGLLAANPALALAPSAAAALGAGDVDSRLLLVLATLAAAHDLSVAEFPVAELDASDAPRRRVLVTEVDGRHAGTAPLLRTWLSAQEPPFRPTLITAVGPALLVGYPAPATAGLLPR